MEKPERFLKGKYWSSEKFREATEKAAKRTQIREKREVENRPEELIENYLKRFTEIFQKEDERERQRGIEVLKRFLHHKYVIKPQNISDDYIKGVLLGNFAEQQGYTLNALKDPETREEILKQFKIATGHSFEGYQVPKEERERIIESIIRDQETRLDSWLSYLISPEAENVPAAYRYWAFAEMLKLGSYDPESKEYNQRTEKTVAPFPELDQQALALVLDEIRKKQIGQPSEILLNDEQSQTEFRKRLQSENFGKLYAFFQEYLKSLRLPTERLFITDGEWRVFPRGSNPQEVVKALSGFHTQWCIAGEGTAASYLSHSDLHIYFSKDANGKNTIPRACVVYSEKHGITEVRGIISDQTAKQHLDDYITPIVEEHLASLPGGERWQAQMKDMRRLAAIHLKHKRGEALSREDLRFLYEIDGKIQTTGYGDDPRVTEILKGRDLKADLSFVLGIPKDQISTTREEALRGNIKYHYGDLDLRDLTTAEGLVFPESVGGSLDLRSLTSAKDLILPKSVGRHLDLRSLTSAKDLILPKSVGWGLRLDSLTSAEGLILPESVGRDLYLISLTSAEGLKLPKSIGGDLDLRSLTSAKNLTLPKSVGGNLYLYSLTSAKGLILPESIGGSLLLNSLTSAKGLIIPKSVGGSLYLDRLTSAEGLVFPESVGWDLYLRSLTSAKGLILPEYVGGRVYLYNLPPDEKEALRKKYPHLTII